jgi:hypothetical protein
MEAEPIVTKILTETGAVAAVLLLVIALMVMAIKALWKMIQDGQTALSDLIERNNAAITALTVVVREIGVQIGKCGK